MTLSLGLISGTSMDGIDAALIACDPDPAARPLVRGYRTYPYEPQLRAALDALLEEGGLERLARLDMAVGEAFAHAATSLLLELSVTPAQVRCIGSHGQTLGHWPQQVSVAGESTGSTLQIGEPAVIAARTGIVTVADFRRMDMALGGQGAPLVPLLDWRAYRHPRRGRVLLNLGGIANLTALPPGCAAQEVVAFDTGPANVLMDAAARARGVMAGYDRDGALAAAGQVVQELLARMLEHPFFGAPPPKSADIGSFLRLMHEAVDPCGVSLETVDLLATLTELTAQTVRGAIERHVAPHQAVDEVLVSGGGVHNRALMARLESLLAPATVAPIPVDAGIVPDAKEAVAFALLALETLQGRPGNLPAVTGASAPALLGKIVMPPAG